MSRFTQFALTLGTAAGLSISPALAEDVFLDFGFDDHTGTTNNMTFTLGVEVRNVPIFGTVSDTDTDTSDVSGNALSTLGLDFASDGSVSSINNLSFTGGRVQFDQDMSFNLSFAFGTAGVDATTTGLAGQFQTLGPASPVNASGQFDLAFHQINVNEGQVDAVGSGFASDINQAFDFTTAPLAAPLTGSANVAITLDSIVEGLATYTATLTAPVSFAASIDPDADTTIDLGAVGNLLATDTFTRQLFEPGDINGDDFVGALDMDIVLNNWGDAVTPGTNGDLNGDGTVGQSDLNLVLNNWGDGTLPSAAVPEPGSLALLGLLTLGLLKRRR